MLGATDQKVQVNQHIVRLQTDSATFGGVLTSNGDAENRKK